MKLLEVRRKGVQRPRAIPRTSSSQILNGVRRSGSSGVLGDIFKKVLGRSPQIHQVGIRNVSLSERREDLVTYDEEMFPWDSDAPEDSSRSVMSEQDLGQYKLNKVEIVKPNGEKIVRLSYVRRNSIYNGESVLKSPKAPSKWKIKGSRVECMPMSLSCNDLSHHMMGKELSFDKELDNDSKFFTSVSLIHSFKAKLMMLIKGDVTNERRPRARKNSSREYDPLDSPSDREGRKFVEARGAAAAKTSTPPEKLLISVSARQCN